MCSPGASSKPGCKSARYARNSRGLCSAPRAASSSLRSAGVAFSWTCATNGWPDPGPALTDQIHSGEMQTASDTTITANMPPKARSGATRATASCDESGSAAARWHAAACACAWTACCSAARCWCVQPGRAACCSSAWAAATCAAACSRVVLPVELVVPTVALGSAVARTLTGALRRRKFVFLEVTRRTLAIEPALQQDCSRRAVHSFAGLTAVGPLLAQPGVASTVDSHSSISSTRADVRLPSCSAKRRARPAAKPSFPFNWRGRPITNTVMASASARRARSATTRRKSRHPGIGADGPSGRAHQPRPARHGLFRGPRLQPAYRAC